jgi:predicted dehydrogenase
MALKVAFIGSGGIAQRHAAGMKKMPEAEIVAAADLDVSRAEKLLDGRGTAYADWKELLAKEEPDAVYVCTPPHVHGEIELALAGRVKAVMVEKPVGNNAAVCSRVGDAFEKAGTIAAGAYMNRYRRSSERAKALLSDPDSPPVTAVGWWVGGMPGVPWWKDRARSGGQMSEQATHVVDLARWLVGDVEEVFAYGAKGFVSAPGATVEDAVVMTMRFASGAVGMVATGCYARPGYASGMGVGLTVASRTVKCVFSGWGMELVATMETGREERVAAQEDIFEIEDRAFLKAAATDDRSLVRSPYPDAVKTLAVTLAANESMERGAPVTPAAV